MVKPKRMIQNLEIKTFIKPNTVSLSEVEAAELRGQLVLVILKVTLQAVLDSVAVWFPTAVENLISPVIFRNVNTDEVFILESKIAGLSFDDFLI